MDVLVVDDFARGEVHGCKLFRSLVVVASLQPISAKKPCDLVPRYLNELLLSKHT